MSKSKTESISVDAEPVLPVKSHTATLSWARDETNTGVQLTFSLRLTDTSEPYTQTAFISDEVLFSEDTKPKVLNSILLELKGMLER